MTHKPSNGPFPPKSISVRVEGLPYLFTNNRELPERYHRIGSISIDMGNGNREYVRIYGSNAHIRSRADGYRFEAAFKAVLGDVTIIEDLFGDVGGSYQLRHFNPSQYLRSKGFGEPDLTSKVDNHEQPKRIHPVQKPGASNRAA